MQIKQIKQGLKEDRAHRENMLKLSTIVKKLRGIIK